MLMCKNTSYDKNNDNVQELYEQMLNVVITSAKESIALVKTGSQREQSCWLE